MDRRHDEHLGRGACAHVYGAQFWRPLCDSSAARVCTKEHCQFLNPQLTINLLSTSTRVFEASITPTFVIMTGMWYKRDEQARRLGIWYSGSGFASIVGAPVAYAIDGSPKTGVLVSWKFLYVISGALTVFVAIAFFFLVPDSQRSAHFLSPAEKVYAIERLRVNQQGIGNKKFKWYQVRELLLDPRTYILFGIQYVSNIGWGATSIFVSTMHPADLCYLFYCY